MVIRELIILKDSELNDVLMIMVGLPHGDKPLGGLPGTRVLLKCIAIIDTTTLILFLFSLIEV